MMHSEEPITKGGKPIYLIFFGLCVAIFAIALFPKTIEGDGYEFRVPLKLFWKTKNVDDLHQKLTHSYLDGDVFFGVALFPSQEASHEEKLVKLKEYVKEIKGEELEVEPMESGLFSLEDSQTGFRFVGNGIPPESMHGYYIEEKKFVALLSSFGFLMEIGPIHDYLVIDEENSAVISVAYNENNLLTRWLINQVVKSFKFTE